jgi:hypothetical protein
MRQSGYLWSSMWLRRKIVGLATGWREKVGSDVALVGSGERVVDGAIFVEDGVHCPSCPSESAGDQIVRTQTRNHR